MSSVYRVANQADLTELTKTLVPHFPKGEIIGLLGELGAGKTTFVQAVCSNLGVTEPVVSPTYSIENQYSASDGMIVHHLDLFRLGPDADVEFLFEILGLKDRLIFVEWPERVQQVLEKVHTFFRITVLENSARTVEILPK